ncbi:MAG: tetratricopeptide repeat protein, partial [Gammaproteobacteria bacterium]|nr:tetratricopeptide repeat protein [Gammaproteobacteria bacterium]
MEFRFLSKVLYIIAGLLFTTAVLATTQPPTVPSVTQQIDAGRQNFNHGRYEDALTAWNAVLDQYRTSDNKSGQARILQYKAEAYLAIGQYYKATGNLEAALALAEASADEKLAAQVAGSLGTAYLLSNRTDEARDLLEKAVTGEQTEGRLGSAAVAGNNLGNLLASQGEFEAAVAVYKRAVSDAREAGNTKLAVKGSANIARALVESGRNKDAMESLERVTKQAKLLSPSHEKAYVLISAGRLYSRLAGTPETSDSELEKLSSEALKTAADTAQLINDSRAMSYAYGYIGALYE